MRNIHHRLVPESLRRALRRKQLWLSTRGLTRKSVSAMMRVKNEALYLEASVRSILPLVEEVVIVDNASTDETVLIAKKLHQLHPGRVRLCHYPHTIARVGAENRELASTPTGQRSPRLLSNYYNWCLARCRQLYVLKWDGDMIAAPALGENLAAFKEGQAHIMTLFGANLHPNHCHLVAAGDQRAYEIQQQMQLPTTVNNWTAPYTDDEPRLFPRVGARYRNDFWWCESLFSPFLYESENIFRTSTCSYLHMKYCKEDPFANFTADFGELIKQGICPGPPIPEELRELVPNRA